MSNTAILTSYKSNFNQFIHSKNPPHNPPARRKSALASPVRVLSTPEPGIFSCGIKIMCFCEKCANLEDDVNIIIKNAH